MVLPFRIGNLALKTHWVVGIPILLTARRFRPSAKRGPEGATASRFVPDRAVWVVLARRGGRGECAASGRQQSGECLRNAAVT